MTDLSDNSRLWVRLEHWPRNRVCALIDHYQRQGGGLRYFGVACNFSQTCSEYTKQAVADLGVIKGCRLGWQRIKRCQHKGLTHKLEDNYRPHKTLEVERV
jgi:uncharacterized protein